MKKVGLERPDDHLVSRIVLHTGRGRMRFSTNSSAAWSIRSEPVTVTTSRVIHMETIML